MASMLGIVAGVFFNRLALLQSAESTLDCRIVCQFLAELGWVNQWSLLLHCYSVVSGKLTGFKLTGDTVQ